MKSKILNTTIILLCVILLACVGCDSVMDRLTPASVPQYAPAYVGGEPQDIYSLHDLKIMQDDILITHRVNQIDLKRLAEDDKYAYQDAIGFIDVAIKEAETFKEKIVGDDNNPLSVSGLLFMLTGGLVGRSFFRRPGDYTPEEVEVEKAKVKENG